MRTDLPGQGTVTARALGLAALAVLLCACDVVSSEVPEPAVLVTVNKRDVTADRLVSLLAAGEIAGVGKDAAARAVETLVDEELLVQEALASGLDRYPAVAASREAASRQTLARLAAEKIVAKAAPANEDAIRRYYDEHPARYAQRSLYQFVVFIVDRQRVTPAIQRELDSAHSAARVRRVLDRRAVAYRTRAMTVAAEDLPADKLPAFKSSVVGDLLLAEHDQQLYLLSVSSVTPAPLDYAAARPLIAQLLNDQARQAALKEFLDLRRARAAIAYHPESLRAYLEARHAGAANPDIDPGLPFIVASEP